MFYFTDKGWQVFDEKISYRETIEVYDTTSDKYQGKDDLMVEEIILTEEQQKRFDAVKHVQSAGVDDIKKYVFEGKVDDPGLVEMQNAIRKEQTRQKLLMLLESGTLTPEEIKAIEDMIGGEP